jgi:hypothetical protein
MAKSASRRSLLAHRVTSRRRSNLALLGRSRRGREQWPKRACRRHGCAGSARGRESGGRRVSLVTFFLTNLLFSGTKTHPAHRFIGALLETIPEAEQARCPRAGLVIPHSGGSGNPPGWHYDRPARSSLPGEPTVTRRASMKRGPGAEPRVQSLGERRGGAPKGERSREGSRPLPA